ncbi:MAG: alpha/beta fold hydrolase [Nitrospirae bacterium]|nr:alpha/beta fold hydrolase [Nitrospirota bacterium]
MRRRLRHLLMVMPFLLSACATSPQIPPWFDSIQRLPVRTVLVQGHRIAYLDTGDGPPIILVHGFGGSIWQWEYQQGPLSATHRVVTLDLLGSGWSAKPDIAYTPTELLEFFRGFMDELGIRRASLVGNSMGAGVVIGMALAYPDRVDRVVLISGLPDHVREKLTSPIIKRALDTWAPVWLVSLGNWLLGRGPTEEVLNELVHDRSLLTPAVIERSYRNRKHPGFIPPLMTLGKNLPLWEEGFAKRLGEIRLPTLILWGAEDRVFPPQVGRALHATIVGSKFSLIPESGHIPQWERPEAVNPILLEFLR